MQQKCIDMFNKWNYNEDTKGKTYQVKPFETIEKLTMLFFCIFIFNNIIYNITKV